MEHTWELTKTDGTTVTVANVDPTQPAVCTGVDPEQEHSIKMTDMATPPATTVTDFYGTRPKKK